MKLLALALALLSSACLALGAEKPKIYNHVTEEDAELDPAIRPGLENKYEVVDFKDPSDYVLPTFVSGTHPRSARTKAGEPLGGTVQLGYVITAEGRTSDVSVLKSTDKQLDAIATKALSEWRFKPARLNGKAVGIVAARSFTFEVAPKEFVEQILEPTGGKISRPKGWFYNEAHRASVFMWTLSREDAAEGKPYDTGVRIQTFMKVQEGAGKSAKQFILDFVEAKKKAADKVLKTCDPQAQGLFTRVCLETEEGPFHIMYSLFWGSKDLDAAVVSIAGTPKELWETYAPTFDKMNAFELIDMKRFEKAK